VPIPIYPALRRLEAAGLIAGSWSVVAGRRRRSYRLTEAGARALPGKR
jgi:DNA-binding PadR family transcriptional regulator